MTKSQRNQMLKKNTIYWITAMLLPAVLYFGFKAFASESAKFPWPVVLPLLFVGLMIGSNALLSRAIGESADEPPAK